MAKRTVSRSTIAVERMVGTDVTVEEKHIDSGRLYDWFLKM